MILILCMYFLYSIKSNFSSSQIFSFLILFIHCCPLHSTLPILSHFDHWIYHLPQTILTQQTPSIYSLSPFLSLDTLCTYQHSTIHFFLPYLSFHFIPLWYTLFMMNFWQVLAKGTFLSQWFWGVFTRCTWFCFRCSQSGVLCRLLWITLQIWRNKSVLSKRIWIIDFQGRIWSSQSWFWARYFNYGTEDPGFILLWLDAQS